MLAELLFLQFPHRENRDIIQGSIANMRGSAKALMWRATCTSYEAVWLGETEFSPATHQPQS